MILPLQRLDRDDLRLVVVGDDDEKPTAPPPCVRCRGTEWLRLDVPANHPAFGKPVPCNRCGAPQARARQAARIWGGSGIPMRFRGLTLDTWRQAARARGGGGWADRLAESLDEWLSTDCWLVLHGPYGVGKSGLTVALLAELGARGESILFSTAADVLTKIRATYDREDGSEREADVLGSLRDVDVLALDDVGAERFTGWVGEKLFVILNERHNQARRTIVTSNLEPSALAEHLTERTFWRVMESATERWIVAVDGPNLRGSLGSAPSEDGDA